jgi:hypothetical protein
MIFDFIDEELFKDLPSNIRCAMYIRPPNKLYTVDGTDALCEVVKYEAFTSDTPEQVVITLAKIKRTDIPVLRTLYPILGNIITGYTVDDLIESQLKD